MKILAITLARGGSKGVVKKNIRPLAGKPLVVHTIQEAQKSKLISEYVVSTDSDEIAAIVESAGAMAPFRRPPELASDTASSVSALQHAVTEMENRRGIKYDYVLELMCTNPLKTVEDIDSCIELSSHGNVKSVVAVARIYDEHPARIKLIENNLLQDFYPEPLEARRQDLEPKVYIRCGSIYLMRRDFLMEEGKRYQSNVTVPYIMDDKRVINIDNEYQFYAAEKMIESAS